MPDQSDTPIEQPEELVGQVEELDTGVEAPVDTQALIEEFEAELPTRSFTGVLSWAIGAVAVMVSIYALAKTQMVIPTQAYRVTFLGAVLALTFMMYPWRRSAARNPNVIDIASSAILAILSVVASAYPFVVGFDAFLRRSVRPNEMDILMGVLMIILVLKATRRTVGWILPPFAVMLLAYAHWGYLLPGDWGHRGYSIERIVGHVYIVLCNCGVGGWCGRMGVQAHIDSRARVAYYRGRVPFLHRPAAGCHWCCFLRCGNWVALVPCEGSAR